jgi:hypothetical protein
MKSILAALVASMALGACQGPGPKTIGEATLAPLALGAAPVPDEARDAPVVEVVPGKTPTIPGDKVVKLAIDRRVPWGLVQAILTKMESQGQTPVLLVVEKRKIKSFHLDDELDGPAIEVPAFTDGKLCVKHPEIIEAKCVKSASETYIEAAYTRELVREAVRGYGLFNVMVELPQDLRWIDVVSAVGGARSCCFEQKVKVRTKAMEADRVLVPLE